MISRFLILLQCSEMLCEQSGMGISQSGIASSGLSGSK
jgi:hypothetical protein